MTEPRRPTALVTGASVGIGYELAKVFAERGHDLVLVARDRARLEQAAAQCRTLGSSVRVIPKDLSEAPAPRELFDELHRDGTRIDVLVNNAGFGTHGCFVEIDLDTDLRLLQVNIVALTHLTKLFAREMVAQGGGKILNVASVAAFQPGPLMATYYASKAYVLHFSEAIAQELRGQGVSVTALCPGPVDTEFQKRAGIEGSRPFRSNRAVDARSVAVAGYDALMRGRRIVIPGIANRILAHTVGFFPRRWVTSIAGRMNEVR